VDEILYRRYVIEVYTEIMPFNFLRSAILTNMAEKQTRDLESKLEPLKTGPHNNLRQQIFENYYSGIAFCAT
jgi:hypothetical protein